jgi:hypothetical protein
MARRASSGINPGIVIGAVIFIVLVAVGGKMLVGHKSTGFDKVRKLDVEAFLENANSMRGNEYSVKGSIDEKLRWTPDRGQVVSLKIDVNGRTEFIGIEIPPQFNHLNIEREQRYAFKVRIRKGGIPVATAVQPQ